MNVFLEIVIELCEIEHIPFIDSLMEDAFILFKLCLIFMCNFVEYVHIYVVDSLRKGNKLETNK